jgi:hypothetical protein
MSESNITLSDLKKLTAKNSHSPDLEITLCKTGRNIMVKPLRVKDKKELLKSLEAKNEILINRVLDDIIENYVVATDGQVFDGKLLSVQERYQILVYIRAANGDEKASIAHQCPKCEKVTKGIEYKIKDDLYVKDYKEPADKGIIHICDDTVELRYDVIYRNEEIAVEEYAKKHKVKSITERQLLMVFASIKECYIVDNGIRKKADMSDFEEKVEFFYSLGTKELNVITKAIEQLDFGVKMPFDFKCSYCDHESQEEVNITVFFIS